MEEIFEGARSDSSNSLSRALDASASQEKSLGPSSATEVPRIIKPRRRVGQNPGNVSRRSPILEVSKRVDYQTRRRPPSLQLSTLPEEEDSEKSTDNSARKGTPTPSPNDPQAKTMPKEDKEPPKPEVESKTDSDALDGNADDAGMRNLFLL